MASREHWMAGAFKNAHGQLHEELGVAKDKKIPVSKLRAAVRGGGKKARQAQAVLNAEHANHVLAA